MLPGILTAVMLMLLGKHQLTVKPVEAEGKLLLKYNATFGIIGLILVAFGVWLLWYWWTSETSDALDLLIMSIISFVLIITGCWSFLMVKNHHVLYSDDEITVASSTRKKESFTWNDVVTMKLNIWTNTYVLTLKSGKKIRIHQYLTGINHFLSKTGYVSSAS